jgi:hypothetical protein
MRALAVVLLALGGCKAGKGQRCLCADDCKNGLVCVTPNGTLEGDECEAPPQVGEPAGMCVESEQQEGGDEADFDPMKLDLGPLYDIPVGPPATSTSATESTGATATGDGSTGVATSSSTSDGESSSSSATGTGSTETSGSTGATSDSSGSTGSSSGG